MKIWIYFLGCMLVGFVLCSCGGAKQVTYLQGSFDTAKLSQVVVPEPVIQKGDLLSITVYSDNPQASALYNQPVLGLGQANTTLDFSLGTTANSSAASGYLVNNDGVIQFQGLGMLHVDGLTKAGLSQLLDSKLKDSLLFNPYYNIRFLNYRVTLLGDVMRPGVYTVPGERVSILEALGLAGDMTLYGKRDDIMVVRELNGKREFGRIDLTNPESMTSPYFYLRQNDKVIVSATKRKAAATDQATSRNVGIVTSIVSAVGIIISILTR